MFLFVIQKEQFLSVVVDFKCINASQFACFQGTTEVKWGFGITSLHCYDTTKHASYLKHLLIQLYPVVVQVALPLTFLSFIYTRTGISLWRSLQNTTEISTMDRG